VNPDSNKLPVLSSTLNSFFLPLVPDTEGGEVKLFLKEGSVNLDTFSFTVTMANTVEIYPLDNTFNRIPNIYYSDTIEDRYNPKANIEGKKVIIPKNNFIIVALDGGTNPPPPSMDYTVIPAPGTTVEARAYNSSSNFYDAQLVAGHTVFTDPSVIGSIQTPWNFYLYSPVIIRTPKLVGQVLMINQDIYNSNIGILSNITRNWSLAMLKARTIVALFLKQHDKIPDGYEPDNLAAPELAAISSTESRLTHKVGVLFTSGEGQINRYDWDENTRFSDKFTSSNTFNNSWKEIINNTSCTVLKSLIEGETISLPLPGDTITFDRETEADFYFSLADVLIGGTITLTMGSANPDPNEITASLVEIDVHIDDLIDYDYLSDPPPAKLAALVQAGWNKYSGITGGAVNIFYVKYHIVNIYNSDTYQCAP